MKKHIETDNDIDDKQSLKRLIFAATFGLSILASSTSLAEIIDSETSNSIVAAMYGFQNAKYLEASSYTDDDYASDLVQSIYGKNTGPDYSQESVYVDLLVRSIEGRSHINAPDFSKDEIYANHLVEIILK